MEAIAETGIPAFDQWEDSVKAKRKKHDPSLEGLPETDRYSKIDHQAVLTHLKELSDQAQTILPPQEDVEETGELNHLAQHAAELPYPPMGSTKDVVFVGRMATGKSTVINAVIGKAVCDTAATGSACTQVVTSYAYLEDELEATEDVKSEVLFFTGAELRDLVRKHLHGLQLHHMEENEETEEDPAESDDEEENSNAVKEESPAAQAMTWFKDVAKLAGMKKTFNADSYTNRAAVCYADGERFTSKAILLASKAIADHMTMKGATSETLDTDGTDLDTQKKSIPVLSINVQENHRAIRPYVSGRFKVIVREVRVRLKSDALKTGTVLRDLPGLGDTNVMRLFATERRRYGDHTAVITTPDRILEDYELHKELAHCIDTSINGALDVSLVLTHNDSIATNLDEINRVLAETDTAPFPALRQHLEDAEARINSIENDENDKTMKNREVNVKEVCANRYCDFIRRLATRAIIKARNKTIRHGLASRITDANGNSGRIFFTSPMLYQHHLKGAADQDCIFTPEETEIPLLRGVLRTLNNDNRLLELQRHVDQEARQLVYQIHKLCLPHSVEDKSTSSIHDLLTSRLIVPIQRLSKTLEDRLVVSIDKEHIFPVVQDERRALIRTLSSTATSWTINQNTNNVVHFNTYKKVCDQGGFFNQTARVTKNNSQWKKHTWIADVQKDILGFLNRFHNAVALPLVREQDYMLRHTDEILQDISSQVHWTGAAYTTLGSAIQDMTDATELIHAFIAAFDGRVQDAVKRALAQSKMHDKGPFVGTPIGIISRYVSPRLKQIKNQVYTGKAGAPALLAPLHSAKKSKKPSKFDHLKDQVEQMVASEGLLKSLEKTVKDALKTEVQQASKSVFRGVLKAATQWQQRSVAYDQAARLTDSEREELVKRLEAGTFDRMGEVLDTLCRAVDVVPPHLRYPLSADDTSALLGSILERNVHTDNPALLDAILEFLDGNVRGKIENGDDEDEEHDHRRTQEKINVAANKLYTMMSAEMHGLHLPTLKHVMTQQDQVMRMQAYVDSARAKEFETMLPPALGTESALASQPAVKHKKEAY